MAILHAFQMRGALLDARGHGLQIEQRPAAGRAGHVIGLEAAAAGRLQNVVGQTQALARARFAANQDRVANAVRQQRADDDGGPQQGNVRLQRRGFKPEAILEQNGIVAAQRLELGGQEAKGGNGGKLHPILHRHQAACRN